MTRKTNPETIEAGSGSSSAEKRTRAFDLPQPDYDERATMHAWERVLSGEDEGSRARLPVRSLIDDSWHRCLSGGIDAQQSEAPMLDGREAVAELARVNGDLLAAARRSFSSIGRLLEGTGAMLVLADAEGVLIDAIGDKRTLFDGMDIHLAVGGKWTEDVVGTNGIGTALCVGEPVFVHAAEHFCAGIKDWTCAGAPIRDPLDGRIIGVVDLSGHPDIFRPHNTALVAAAACKIENALAEQQAEERSRLLEAFIATAPNYRRSDGLMIVDRLGRAVYRSNLPAGIATRFPVGPQAEPRGRQVPDASFIEQLAKGLPAVLRACDVRPLTLDGDLRGAALLLPSAPRSAGGQTARPAGPSRSGEAPLIVGESGPLLQAIDAASRVARAREVASLLIEGETGVGKELFARLVHMLGQQGPRDPFVVINCGAITRDLIGAELFGHVAGAFTGATREGRPGVFELADGGVLCLDEIGELPLEIQPFLLRVLEERVVQRIGDSRRRPVEVRLVASTNRDLKAEVAAGRFRRDLYYRISTVTIQVPPLRDRGGDVLLLLQHFNHGIAKRTQRPPLDFSGEALDTLRAYHWPGNVRELKNLVERLHVLARESWIGLDDLPADLLQPPQPVLADAAEDEPMAIRSFMDAERVALKNALAAEHGNLSRVAQRLGISRPTLYRKLDQHGIRRGFV